MSGPRLVLDLLCHPTVPQVRVGVVWQVELPEDAGFVRLAGDQRWLAQASIKLPHPRLGLPWLAFLRALFLQVDVASRWVHQAPWQCNWGRHCPRKTMCLAATSPACCSLARCAGAAGGAAGQ